MSNIFYYSKRCDKCTKYLKIFASLGIENTIHFICIDKIIQEEGKKFVILDNNQKVILPKTVTHVPALMLLNKGYKVLFGNEILSYLQPIKEKEIIRATHNNMEPFAYSFSSSSGNIVSDSYSFIQEEPIQATDNTGMKQLYNYSTIQDNGLFTIPSVQHNFQGNKDDNLSLNAKEERVNQETNNLMNKMKAQRDADMENIFGKRPTQPTFI